MLVSSLTACAAETARQYLNRMARWSAACEKSGGVVEVGHFGRIQGCINPQCRLMVWPRLSEKDLVDECNRIRGFVQRTYWGKAVACLDPDCQKHVASE